MNKEKNIIEAMASQRPGDRIEKVLSNKFAIVSTIYTDGKFDKKCIMGLDNGVIYTYGYLSYINTIIAFYKNLPNIERTMWCFDHKENGKPFHYVFKIGKNNRLKAVYRKLEKLI